MPFFNELHELLDGVDVSMTIKRKGEKLTISVLPTTASEISPVIVTGTPDDLNEGFIGSIKAPIETARGLDVLTDEFNESVKDKKEGLQEKPKTATGKKPDKKSEKKSGKKSADPKPEPKQEEPRQEPDLFSQNDDDAQAGEK